LTDTATGLDKVRHAPLGGRQDLGPIGFPERRNGAGQVKQGCITNFVFNGGDFFVANLDNGGIRFGMKGVGFLQAPAGHPVYAEIAAVTAEAAESFFDAKVESGQIVLN
jgi:hypothetical protein